MATNVGQGNFGFENLFKNAKKFYANTNKNKEDVNGNTDAKGTSLAIAGSESPNDSNNNRSNSSPQETKQNDETPVFNKFRNFMKRNKNKDIEDTQTSENANIEIRSEKGSLNGVARDSNYNPGERCRAEDCKNYALSNSLNPEKLTEIINNSIKAAVENLANDVKPPCWKEENNEVESVAVPLDSPCFNDTCPQRNKTINNKDNVKNSTQYSQQAAVPSIRPKTSGNISSIYGNNNNSSARDSKRSYNSNKKSSQRELATCCLPSSKSGTTSAVCHQSVSKYKQTICPCKKEKADKSSKSYKPCKLLKTDNRRMTGNVNIYICSEGNDGAGGKNNKKNKKSESTCNSMTATNASCNCSSTEVCDCHSSTSSKTIRNLMTKNKNEKNITDDITLKCACGKPPPDCQCQSKNPENEELCLCDMSSLNPTTSLETCRDTLDYNLHSPKTSDPSPHGDYCVNRVRSRSSSRHEQCCARENFVSPNVTNGVENSSGSYVEKSKFTSFDSGHGDAVQDCSHCDTYSDYSEGKLNHCNCNVTNPSSRNQSERYVIQNIVNYGASREEKPCNCCKYDNESLYSSGKKSEIDESVCCENKPRIQQTQKKECCRKSCSPSRSTAYDNNGRQRWRNSDYCIVEEENEECDPSCCKFFTPKEQNLKTGSNSQKGSRTPCGRESNIRDKKEHPSSEIKAKEDYARISSDNGRPTSQSVATKMSVDEVVKSFSNVDKSTSSIFFSLNSSTSPQSSPSKPKESKKSSLKWPFSKAKSLIGGKSTTAEIETKKNSPITDTPKLEANTTSVEPVKDETANEKITNGKSFSTVAKSTAGEKSTSANGGDSLITIKSSNDQETKSKDFLTDVKKTKLSSSKLGSLIADRKNSVQSATNETALSHEDNQSNGTCQCGAVDADMCTCQYPQCKCCNRLKEYCKCDGRKNRTEEEQSCNVCEQSKQLCCCIKQQQQQQKKHRTLSESDDFRVCTLCCRPEINCCCNNFAGQNSSRRSRTPSNLCNGNKNPDSYESVGRKSQICVYCERPREKCTCRAPVKKCSYCGMPVDVCNCQDVGVSCNACSYEGNTCQCNGRVIENSDGGDQNICVTAWKPRREIRKYFSRNPGERDSPDCSCCETVRPYGSDELPYQRLSVFSDVMTELQQKMNELPCCNRCKKIPCCCYVQESKSHSRYIFLILASHTLNFSDIGHVLNDLCNAVENNEHQFLLYFSQFTSMYPIFKKFMMCI